MTGPEIDRLNPETDVFCRYLIGRPADEYVVSRYRKAHHVGALSLSHRGSRFEELLVRIARIAPAFTRLADAYASVFAGRKLRSKLVLMLAILENSPAHYDCVNAPPTCSRGIFLLRAGIMAAVYLAHVVAAILVIMPLRLLCWLLGDDRSSSL